MSDFDVEKDGRKTIFLPDYLRLEQSLEKQLRDPNMPFNERLSIENKLMNLKFRWQENGVGDLDLVIAMRDGILDFLRTLGTMNLTSDAVSEDAKAHLAELNKIIAEGKKKGMA